MTSQQKLRHTLDKSGSLRRSLLLTFNFVRYLCCKEKTDYTSSISQKYLTGDGKHAENKEIYTRLKLSANSLPIRRLPIRQAEVVCQFDLSKKY